MTLDPWHFPRPQLAEQWHLALTKGPSKALTLFGPRRIGKTEFLLQDLVPFAEAQGHQIVYASFWQVQFAPIEVLEAALEDAVKGGSIAERVLAATRGIEPSLKIGATGPSAELRKKTSRSVDEDAAQRLRRIDHLIGKLQNEDRPAILLLDEVQELARDEANRPLVAALRTSLDIRYTGVRALFTGSSREGLAAMFGDREAPFFQFGGSIDMPELGDEFAVHLLGAYKDATGRTLDKDAAIDAFGRLHRSPFYFRTLMEILTLRRDLTIEEGEELCRARVAERLGYDRTWLSLSPIQRAVVLAVAEGMEKPFSADGLQTVAKKLGEKEVTTSKVQKALQKLSEKGLVDRWEKQWVLTDPALRIWLQNRGVH